MKTYPRHLFESRLTGRAANWTLALGLVVFLLAVFTMERWMTSDVIEVDALYALAALCGIVFLSLRAGLAVAGLAASLPVMTAVLGETTYANAALQAGTLVAMCGLTLAISAARTSRIQSDTAKLLTGRKAESLRLLSHELRTPLSAVMGYAGLLEEMPDLESHKEQIQSILQGADRLNRVVDAILDVEPWWIESAQLEERATSDVDDAPRRPSGFAKWVASLPASWSVIAAVIWIAGVTVLDLFTGQNLTLSSLLALAPLLASLRASVGAVTMISVASIAFSSSLGISDGAFLSGQHLVDMLAVICVGTLSVAVAYLRGYLEISRLEAERRR